MSKIDSYMLSLGIVKIESIDDEATIQAMVPDALNYLMVNSFGGQFSLDAWAALSSETRAALGYAARLLAGEKMEKRQEMPVKASVGPSRGSNEIVIDREEDLMPHIKAVADRVAERMSE